MKKVKIEEVYRKNYVFIDTRSPKEFAEDHIHGAINIPLFTNEERAIVGAIYKQLSPEMAMDKGLEIVSAKLPVMIEAYKKYKNKKLCVYCWRGGMRSHSVVSLLASLKFDVVQLENGYKDYRRFVREELEKIEIPKFIMLYGLTGVGKTEILKQFENSIDLEGFAQHRGSIFGDIGLQQNTQKRFETLLLEKLYDLQGVQYIFVEGEARKVGQILLPLRLWKHMQEGKNVRVVCSDDERVERLYKEYCNTLDVPLFVEKIKQIEKFLGKKHAEELIQSLQEGKVKEVIAEILVKYYDVLYAHSVDAKNYLFEVHSAEELREKAIVLAK